MGRGVPIHLLGMSFAIQTDESPEYVERLVSFVKDKIAVLQQSIGSTDRLRIAVLAAILIADELFKTREKQPAAGADSDRLENMTDSIIAKLDKALES